MDPATFSKLSISDNSLQPVVCQGNTIVSGTSDSPDVCVSSPRGSRKRSREGQPEEKPDIWQSKRVLPFRSYSQRKEETLGSDEGDGGVPLKHASGTGDYPKAITTRVSAATELQKSLCKPSHVQQTVSDSATASSSKIWSMQPNAKDLVSTDEKQLIQTVQHDSQKTRSGTRHRRRKNGSNSLSLDPMAPSFTPADPMLIDESSTPSAPPPERYINIFDPISKRLIIEPIKKSNIIDSSRRIVSSSDPSPGVKISTTNAVQNPRIYPQRDTTVANQPLKPVHKAALKPKKPKPDAEYILQSSQIPHISTIPQRLLLVLDLNGTLVFRRKGGPTFTPRPLLRDFLQYCFNTHSVFIWSSARPENVNAVCSGIFTPAQRKQLVGEWGRDTLELTHDEYFEKVQVYKRLDRLWDNASVQSTHPDYERGGRWSQANTVLIDDSKLKAAKQPYNHIEIPEYLGNKKEKGSGVNEILARVVSYLEAARWWGDVSCFIKYQSFKVHEWQKWDWEKVPQNDANSPPKESQSSRRMLGVYIPPQART
jgi:hypothetical protein